MGEREWDCAYIDAHVNSVSALSLVEGLGLLTGSDDFSLKVVLGSRIALRIAPSIYSYGIEKVA
jgi:hypothetical protein